MPSRFVVEQIPFYAHSLAIAYQKVIQTPKEEIALSSAVLDELLLLGPIFQKDAHIPKQDQLSRSQVKKRAAALVHSIYAELSKYSMQKGERAAMREGLIEQEKEDFGEYWIVPGQDEVS